MVKRSNSRGKAKEKEQKVHRKRLLLLKVEKF